MLGALFPLLPLPRLLWQLLMLLPLLLLLGLRRWLALGCVLACLEYERGWYL